MRIQRGATGVLERTAHYLRAGLLQEQPAWYKVVGANPPLTDLTKRAKLFGAGRRKADPAALQGRRAGGFKTRADSVDRRHVHKTVLRVPQLRFVEDQLRDVFYHQHPWEFSRPKVLVENEGDDHARCDWSHMLQLAKPLDGELVVQRTLWLLQAAKREGRVALMEEAYTQARFEFYRLRMEEEMNSTVLREELAMHGAVFALLHAQWGVAQEQHYVDAWARVGAEQTQIAEAQRGGRGANGSVGRDDVPEEKLLVWEAQEAA